MDFTHLHVHSHYSLLDGLSKIDELIDYAKNLGMDALALTDHANLYGAVEFYKKAKAKNIKPIIGAELYLAHGSRFSKDPKVDSVRYHLTLLVKNKIGYQNLSRLITQSHLEGFYYRPRVDRELLTQYHEGLICLSGCFLGEISRQIQLGRLEKAEEAAFFYKKLFGENFYIEIQPHAPELHGSLKSIAEKFNIPLVATQDSHYLKKEDAPIHEVLLAIQTNNRVTSEEKSNYANLDLSLKSAEEMKEIFQNTPEAIENTQQIAQSCNFEFELNKTLLPKYKTPENGNGNGVNYLKKIVYQQFYKKFTDQDKEAKERLDYELSIIEKTGFSDYFLIVQDFVSWAKNHGIVVGPGRGCFLPDTKILLKDGRQKNIQDIKAGERIITAFGNKRKVKKILSYDIDEKIATIKSKMPVFDLKLTKDHKVLIARHKMCSVKSAKSVICKPSCNRPCKKNLWKKYKLEWIQAQDIKKNNFLLYPIVKHKQIKEIKFDTLNFNDLDTRLKGDNKYVWYEVGSNRLIQKKIKRYIKLDEKFARLLGFYISEGWVRTRRKYREATIGFGFHQNEKTYIEEVRKLLKQIFGLDSSLKFHKTKKSCQVNAYSRIVAKLLERFCGKGSQNKHIPYQIFESSDEIAISLLTSLFKGDGSRKDTMRVSLDSTSLDLVSQVKMLLAKLTIMSSIKIRKHKGTKEKDSYKLTISGKQLFKFNKLFKEFQIPIKKQKFYRNDTFIWRNYIWFPVKEISFKKYKGKVHDLTIEKDVSYVANEISVHNSAAGSLVSYVLGITGVNPLDHDLFFERFLNPERIQMPDIDIDFAHDRRAEILGYLKEKYGEDRVAQIITFGTMAARAAVRDAGRALGFPYSFVDHIARLIPFEPNQDKFGSQLEQHLKNVDELRKEYENNQDIKKIIDAARRLEGVARHASVHAAGVIVTPEPIANYMPLQRSPQDESNVITQYEMYSVEDLGLLKIDLLGLKNLTIIESALRLIKEKGINLKIEEIPLDDKKAFELIHRGETIGVFQFEGSGMTRWLVAMKANRFEDLVAMVALFRPGPMELIPNYISRKHGKEPIVYLHPKLEPILKNTYGVIVYQEQLLKIARDLAGFSIGEADILRKAVGKKIKALLDEQAEKFISGVEKHIGSRTLGEKLWKLAEPFARYGFNKSHSVCYALIGYQTAYLKAHFPIEFMTSLLNNGAQDVEAIAVLANECRRMKIEVLAPDINKSYINFTPEENNVRFGLNAIKNIGANIANLIVEERFRGGLFKNLEDFLSRINHRDLNKKSLESLIKGGALDVFQTERKTLLANLDEILKIMNLYKKSATNAQSSLFGQTPPLTLKLQKVDPASTEEKMLWEKELLGLFLTEHPLNNKKYNGGRQNGAVSIAKTLQNKEGGMAHIIGLVSKITRITAKNGQPMLFAKIEDLNDNIEILVFSDVLLKNPDIWKENSILEIKGRVSRKNGDLKIICQIAKKL